MRVSPECYYSGWMPCLSPFSGAPGLLPILRDSDHSRTFHKGATVGHGEGATRTRVGASRWSVGQYRSPILLAAFTALLTAMSAAYLRSMVGSFQP